MNYISSIERIAIEEGLQKGILQKAQEDILEVLTIRFGELPQGLSEAINRLTDAAMLKMLHRQAITIESLDKFEQVLENLPKDAPSQTQVSPDLND